MALDLEEDFVLLKCINTHHAAEEIMQEEILISAEDIRDWDLPTILASRVVKVRANRSRLIGESSYFRGLLSGSFCESHLGCISIQWSLETVISLLKIMYCCPLDVDSNNFIPLFEGALFFGVEKLLLACKAWLSKMTSPQGFCSSRFQLDDLIHIWKFGLDHADDFIPELCTSCLARNFMWVMSSDSFGDIPYNLLFSCLKHPHLTVDSEKDLCNALLVWVGTNRDCSKDGFSSILKQVRKSLLPLWFAAGKKVCCYLSEFADESIHAIVSLTKYPSMDSLSALGDGDLRHLRIRLTEYSKKVDLSSCPQTTVALLLISVLPCSYAMDPKLRKSSQLSLLNLGHLESDERPLLRGSLPALTFSAVQEVNISKCPRLHLETAIKCLCKSFPSLRTLKAAHFLNFKTRSVCQLVQNFPLLFEADLTVDVSPVIPTEVSVVSSSSLQMPLVSRLSLSLQNYPIEHRSFSVTRPLLQNLTKLTLQGRNDVSDSDLQAISGIGVSLCYLNLKGCTSVTDVGISVLIDRCIKLHSILVCYTSFGTNSVLALCSDSSNLGSPGEQLEQKNVNPLPLAYKLKELHMGGCKGVGETSLQELMSQMHMLKSLCLRGTCLIDNALLALSCSSLGMLDVSDTMVSGTALAQVVSRNRDLKCLKARGCTNLLQQDSAGGCFPQCCKELHLELGKTRKLEEIALGWGFSSFPLEAFGPAIASLRALTVGLGGSLRQDSLALLPTACPILESVILYFQVISDSILIGFVESLKHLQVLALCYCFGDLSSFSFRCSMPNLRNLKLERVTPWLTNDDLVILTRSFRNLVEFSLLGCTLLNSDSQCIISRGWPGLISLSLEDCGEVTANGIAPFFDCKALEDLLLRHNGPGICANFILDAAFKLPMLRKLSLDLCDSTEGDFHLPNGADRYFLSTVKIARCKSRKRDSDLLISEAFRMRAHKETLVLVWNSKGLTRTVVRERV